MTLCKNFPGRIHQKRRGALERLRAQRLESLAEWQAKERHSSDPKRAAKVLTADDLKKRNARQDREIAHLEKIQAADVNPLGRHTKKVQANLGR